MVFGIDADESESDPENEVLRKFMSSKMKDVGKLRDLDIDSDDEELRQNEGELGAAAVEEEEEEVGSDDNVSGRFTYSFLNQLHSLQMVVEDTTPQEAPSKRKCKRKQSKSDESKSDDDDNSSKVKLREFQPMNGMKTAVLGKRIYRTYTCLDNMLPGDETTLYQHVFDHVAEIQGDTTHADALKLIGAQPDVRRRFLAFVSSFGLLSKLLLYNLAFRCITVFRLFV